MFEWIKNKWNYVKGSAKLQAQNTRNRIKSIMSYSDSQVDFFIYMGLFLVLASIWIAYTENKFDLSTTVFATSLWFAGFGYWRFLGRPQDEG